MARAQPITGAFRERFSQPYAGPQVWGTGYNLVHMDYGSPADRQKALRPREGEVNVTPPGASVPEQIESETLWGYTPEDTRNQFFVRDDRPDWTIETPENPSRYTTGDQPPVNATGAAKTRFRATMGGAFSKFRGKLPRADYYVPSETVSEGWINKPQGRPANSKPSDPAQYERQTSMQQRYRSRGNELAVLRGTDAPRFHINSRVTGQRLKVYSEGERNYDMYPRQQTADLERPFYYRTAGTGIQSQMSVNELWDISPMERTPSPDPYIGQEDTSLQYGYTPEDNFYA